MQYEPIVTPPLAGKQRDRPSPPKAVVLLSGGMDSATCCFEARAAGYALFALTVNYGQRAQREIQAAQEIAAAAGAIRHIVYPMDLTLWGGSALTDATLGIPAGGVDESMIPITYVPARNTILLSLALGWAEVLGAAAIYIGVTSRDYSGYPDCRPEFITAYQQLVGVATKATVEGGFIKIETPLQYLSKVEIARRALALGVPLDRTWSCYAAGSEPCGVCDSCRLREEALALAHTLSTRHFSAT
jgi:7-cyano-7-deazaguanine synthase